MATLYLLRHARASWPSPGARDFDRPLERAGLDDAVALGIRMANEDLFPARAICSTAKRAQETLREVIVGMDTTFPVTHDEKLYSAAAADYLDIIRQAGGNGPLLLVGHNPRREDTAAMLVDRSNGGDRRLLDGFPAGGMAILDFTTSLADIEPGRGTLRDFLRPGDA